MIIDASEVHRFESACREFSRVPIINSWPGRSIREHIPSILAAYGYQEMAWGSTFSKPHDLQEVSFWDHIEATRFLLHPDGRWFDPMLPPIDWSQPWLALSQGDMAEIFKGRSLRRGENGEFFSDCREVHVNYVTVAPSLEAVIETAWAAAESVSVERETLIISPRFWSPGEQRRQLDAIQETAKSVMAAARAETLKLEDLSWKQLEEVVAHVLSSRGMKIHIVKESPQGGRDIVARGELIPGLDPITIAVEVKHRKVVNRPEVQMALWQNRQYPALLFVTSGRFSSGVIDEGELSENRLRLHLWDGVTLQRLIGAL